MLPFCDVLHDAKQKKHKQTLEGAQKGLEISFKTPFQFASLYFIHAAKLLLRISLENI